jgi:hypothetical protein
MLPEAHAGRDEVLVDHPQRPETHVVPVDVAPEAERVERVEPAVVEMAALLALPDRDHGPVPFHVVYHWHEASRP